MHIRSLTAFGKFIYSMSENILSNLYKNLEIGSLVNDSIRELWKRDCEGER